MVLARCVALPMHYARQLQRCVVASAPQPANPLAAGQTQWWLAGAAFMPATTFQGHRAGYVFQLGLSGLGYYTDPRSASSAAGAGALAMVPA